MENLGFVFHAFLLMTVTDVCTQLFGLCRTFIGPIYNDINLKCLSTYSPFCWILVWTTYTRRGSHDGYAEPHCLVGTPSSCTCVPSLGEPHGRPRLYDSLLHFSYPCHSKDGTLSHGAVCHNGGAGSHGDDTFLLVLLQFLDEKSHFAASYESNGYFG